MYLYITWRLLAPSCYYGTAIEGAESVGSVRKPG